MTGSPTFRWVGYRRLPKLNMGEPSTGKASGTLSVARAFELLHSRSRRCVPLASPVPSMQESPTSVLPSRISAHTALPHTRKSMPTQARAWHPDNATPPLMSNGRPFLIRRGSVGNRTGPIPLRSAGSRHQEDQKSECQALRTLPLRSAPGTDSDDHVEDVRRAIDGSGFARS